MRFGDTGFSEIRFGESALRRNVIYPANWESAKRDSARICLSELSFGEMKFSETEFSEMGLGLSFIMGEIDFPRYGNRRVGNFSANGIQRNSDSS